MAVEGLVGESDKAIFAVWQQEEQVLVMLKERSVAGSLWIVEAHRVRVRSIQRVRADGQMPVREEKFVGDTLRTSRVNFFGARGERALTIGPGNEAGWAGCCVWRGNLGSFILTKSFRLVSLLVFGGVIGSYR